MGPLAALFLGLLLGLAGPALAQPDLARARRLCVRALQAGSAEEARRLVQEALLSLPSEAPASLSRRLQEARAADWPQPAGRILRQVQEDLDTWDRARERPGASPAQAQRAQAILARVLQSREFTQAGAVEEALRQGVAWLRRWLDRLTGWLGQLLGASLEVPPSALEALAWGLVSLAGLILALLLAGGLAGLGRRRPRGPEAATFPSAAQVRRPSSGWLAEAEEAAAAGDYRGGMRFLFLALLRSLQEQGVLSPGLEVRTNWEILQLLA
ncbi:MAG TPA: hypothetical protein VNO81_11500, partial [Candidatus Nitrosotenuis sp.]|nr:hypothetical protein [Candidatus Nitrosotenuis sp.]